MLNSQLTFQINGGNMNDLSTTKKYIEEKVKNHKCPSYFFCVVATTGYSEERRTSICTDCWESYLKNPLEGIDTLL